MPMLTVEVSHEVAAVLQRQASALLLRRPAYLRVVLAAVAAQAEAELPEHKRCSHCGAKRRQRETQMAVETSPSR